MKDIMKFIQLSGLPIDVEELGAMTDHFKKNGVSLVAAQKMAISAKIAELKEDERQIKRAIKKAKKV